MDHVMQNIKSMQTSEAARSINIRMMWLSIISISVGFFAGSVFLQAFLDAGAGPDITVATVIAASLVVAALCVLAFLSPRLWARIRNHRHGRR